MHNGRYLNVMDSPELCGHFSAFVILISYVISLNHHKNAIQKNPPPKKIMCHNTYYFTLYLSNPLSPFLPFISSFWHHKQIKRKKKKKAMPVQ